MIETPTIDLTWGIETEPPSVTFAYGAIERAIALIHNVAPDAMKTLRSRVKHFQRIGLVPSSPGKGQKLRYMIGDAIRWAICFELAECGLPPEQIKDVLRLCARPLFGAFSKLSYPLGPPTEDQIFVLRGNFLQWHLEPSEHTYSEMFMNAIEGDGAVMAGVVPVSKLQDLFAKATMTRGVLINLSELRRALAPALGIEWR